MYIGKLAQLTGVSPKAIRLYEAIGLLPPPTRIGKYRFYREQDVDAVRLIKEAQALGFKLAEIRELGTEGDPETAFPWEKAIELVERKRRQVRQMIRDLREQERQMGKFLQQLRDRSCLCRAPSDP